MPGMSIHVVDVSSGQVAAGMQVEVWRLDPEEPLCAGRISPTGVMDAPRLAARLPPGPYEVRLHVADFFRSRATPLPRVPFLDVVSFRFGIDDAEQHYHLPMKLTAWGLSCFRGGA